ncbi:MAG: DUF4126 domain-containing protein [Anaerolineae bacterium]|nr:DUF4126 domain-containing protein [Anaerolineae bacterium]
MIEAVSGLAAAFGLASSAGLNAYLPLLIVALTARFTPLIRLRPPFDLLTNGWIMLLLAVLLAIEVVADKIPAVDTANDVIQTFIRPIAGAILFAASARVIVEIHPLLAIACGVLVAGGVHAAKATARPAITAASAGVLNPVVSTGEDILSAVISVLSVLVPLVILVVVPALVVLLILSRRRRAARSGAGGA